MMTYDSPEELAIAVDGARRPLLVGLDVDGVLAPLVDDPVDSRLLDGVDVAVSAVASLPDITVAVVSGRSLDGLAQFGFGSDVAVVGSHGMETRDRPMEPLDDIERRRLADLGDLMIEAVAAAGDGAWIERKPASLVLHVRTADTDRGRTALEQLRRDSDRVEGAAAKAGRDVLELFARHADKGSAMLQLADRIGAVTIVFVGDDLTDEDAFARLGPADIAIKVGDADTIAPHRLRDPEAALAFLQSLAQHR